MTTLNRIVGKLLLSKRKKIEAFLPTTQNTETNTSLSVSRHHHHKKFDTNGEKRQKSLSFYTTATKTCISYTTATRQPRGRVRI